MKSLEKLQHYRERLESWKRARDAKAIGAEFNQEPNPADFHLTSTAERVLADGIRKRVLIYT